MIQPKQGASHERNRELAGSNPLTFRERSDLVEAALVTNKICRERFQVTPFPIETPERLNEFVPAGCMCFTTLVDEWNDEKVRRLNLHGYPTTILSLSVPDDMRVTSGTEIRRLIRASNPSWARFVPVAVAEAIESGLKHRFGETKLSI